jgi:hypothetical protein
MRLTASFILAALRLPQLPEPTKQEIAHLNSQRSHSVKLIRPALCHWTLFPGIIPFS